MDTKEEFQWRIRNLPYPPEVFSVSVDTDNHHIVVRTSNKKYFKRINVPDLKRAHLPTEQQAIKWYHANNTLVISYVKPPQIVALERKEAVERRQLKVVRNNDRINVKR